MALIEHNLLQSGWIYASVASAQFQCTVIFFGTVYLSVYVHFKRYVCKISKVTIRCPLYAIFMERVLQKPLKCSRTNTFRGKKLEDQSPWPTIAYSFHSFLTNKVPVVLFKWRIGGKWNHLKHNGHFDKSTWSTCNFILFNFFGRYF